MRTEQRTKMVPTAYTVYIAEDGTEWQSKEACEKHERLSIPLEIEGVRWYDGGGRVIPISGENWEKVQAIWFDNPQKDYALFGVLEQIEDEMSYMGQEKFSAYRDIDLGEGSEPYTLLYRPEENKWIFLVKEYLILKDWVHKLS